MRKQKGITLIALIITIVVLLILAVVTIRTVQGDGIINYAKNSRGAYEEGQEAEQDMLEYYESYLSGTVGTTWSQEGATIKKTNADGTITKIKIGDYVNYNEGTYTHTPVLAKGAGTSKTGGSSSEGYTLSTSELKTENLSWRVLGLDEKGQIELISSEPTDAKLYLANAEGYIYGEDNLNTFCNDLYGKGTNNKGKKVAIEARSLDVEDINKITNYDPTTYSGYDYNWTFKYPTDDEVKASTTGLTKNMWYKTTKEDGTLVNDWTNMTATYLQTFSLPDGRTISASKPGTIEVTNRRFAYQIIKNLTTEDGYTSEEITEILNMIVTPNVSASKTCQWLASKYASCFSELTSSFMLRFISNTGWVQSGIQHTRNI